MIDQHTGTIFDLKIVVKNERIILRGLLETYNCISLMFPTVFLLLVMCQILSRFPPVYNLGSSQIYVQHETNVKKLILTQSMSPSMFEIIQDL